MNTNITIEVFRTNVRLEYQARIILAYLAQLFPKCRINFDLDDCDKILRIEGCSYCPVTVCKVLEERGFHCSVLD